MPFQIGERVSDYEVVKILGAGGMGEVYKVRHVISDRVEAMKVLLPNLEGDPELADRFLREIKVQASLSHPNIAALHTAVKHGKQLLMLMEFVEGQSLEEKLRAGALNAELGIRYIAQVLDALAYAHSRGVIHRDIKPANIMVTADGAIKLMDFGIARMKEDRRLTSTGQTVGSLFYMSPEQIRGEELDARSDLYSLGISLYEVVTGKRPFEGTSDYSIMAAHLQQNPVPPIQIDPRVPQRLNEIILTAIAKDRDQRFQKAEAFGNALRNTLTELQRPAQGAAPPPLQPPLPPPAKPAPAVTLPAPAAPSSSPPAWGRYAAVVAGLLFIGLAASQIPKWRSAEPASTSQQQEQAPEIQKNLPEPQQQPPPATVPAPVLETPSPAGAQPLAQQPPTAQQQPVTRQATAQQPVTQQPVTQQPTTQQPTTPSSRPVQPEAAAAVEQPVVKPAPPQQVQAPPPQKAPPQSAVDDKLRDAQQDRLMELSIRVGAIATKTRSLERQQAAQGVGMRSDVKSDQTLLTYLMDQAEQRLRSGDAAAAKSSLDKAEHLVEKLERILGL